MVVVGGGVGLALERADHVGPGEVVQERPGWPREGQQLGEVDVVRCWRRRRRFDGRLCRLGQCGPGQRQALYRDGKDGWFRFHCCPALQLQTKLRSWRSCERIAGEFLTAGQAPTTDVLAASRPRALGVSLCPSPIADTRKTVTWTANEKPV